MVPICVTNGGEIVAGTDDQDGCGIFIYDGARWEYHEAPFSGPGISDAIFTVMADRKDDIWMGTGRKGLGLWVLHRNPGQPTVQVGISVDKAQYAANDVMRAYLDVTCSESHTVDLYVAVQLPAGDLLFYPNLGSSWFPFWTGLLLLAGTEVPGYELFTLTLPELPAGTYRWFAACTHAGSMDLASNIASCDWQFE